MTTPIDLNSQASDRPSYLASLDDALAGRHELVDIIVAAFRSSQEPMPVVVKKQKSGGHEVISLARYTGRSTMDIVDLQ